MKLQNAELEKILESYSEYEMEYLTQEDFKDLPMDAFSFIRSSTESILEYASEMFGGINPLVAGYSSIHYKKLSNRVTFLKEGNYKWMVQKDTLVSNIPGLKVRMPELYEVMTKEFAVFTSSRMLEDRVDNIRKFLTDDEFRIGFRLDDEEIKATEELLNENAIEFAACFGGKNALDTTTFDKLYGNMGELQDAFYSARNIEKKDIRARVKDMHAVYIEYDEYAREVVKFLDGKPTVHTGNIKALMTDMRLAAIGFTQFGKLVNLLVMADNCILDAFSKLKK